MTETKVKVRTEYHPVVLHTHPVLDLDEEQFFRFCQQNRDLRIERTAEGDLENGARLGWLLDPGEKRVHVYQPEEDVRILEDPQKVSGDPVLQSFVLDLKLIWEPGF